MLKNPKKPIYKNCNIFEKYPKGGPFEKFFFSFLNNTEFYYGISKETIRMPFRGLAMLKSTKLIIKGGLCYRFAMVQVTGREIIDLEGQHGSAHCFVNRSHFQLNGL